MNTTTIETLARALIAHGLGGSAPYTAARSLLLALETQAGGTDDHHERHAAQYARMSPAYLRELMAASNEGGRMSILARLAHAGWALERLVALVAEQTKERAA